MTTPSIREALKHALASLVAAISLLERTPRAKKAAPSDKMFDQMIADYKAAIEQGRAALAALPQDVGEGIVSLLKENIRIQVYGDDATAQIRDDNLTLCATAILASGLVTAADEAFIRAEWHTTGWDRARNSGRILLVWREFEGVREHVELGRYSDSKTAWVNTYGHPFHCEPDGWAPLLPFATETAIRADERERCAKVAEESHAGIHDHLGSVARNIAAAIRAEDPMTLKVIR